MLAVKENKQLQIEEKDKTYYLATGYDIAEIVEGELKIIENAPGKTVTYAKYKEALDKIAGLQKEIEELKLSAMTVDQLKAYAADKKVDLGDASTKDAILLKFKEV